MSKLLNYFLFFLQLGLVGSIFLLYLTALPQQVKAAEIICPDGKTKCDAQSKVCKMDDDTGEWKCGAKGSLQEFKDTGLYQKVPSTFREGDEIKSTAPKKLAEDAFQWFVIIAGALSVAGLVYGGIMYATAGGSEDRINKAKTIVLWSLVGGVIILLAWGLVNFIVTRLSTDEGIPTPSI